MTERVRLIVNGNEIEVEGDRAFVQEQLDKYIHLLERNTAPPVSERSPATATQQPAKPLTPAEYVRRAQPSGGKETLLVLASYIERFQAKPDFSIQELNEVASQAKLKDIHNQYFSLATKDGLLRNTGKGRYALSLSGEDLVRTRVTAE